MQAQARERKRYNGSCHVSFLAGKPRAFAQGRAFFEFGSLVQTSEAIVSLAAGRGRRSRRRWRWGASADRDQLGELVDVADIHSGAARPLDEGGRDPERAQLDEIVHVAANAQGL